MCDLPCINNIAVFHNDSVLHVAQMFRASASLLLLSFFHFLIFTFLSFDTVEGNKNESKSGKLKEAICIVKTLMKG
jgi:hypothetical protein